MSADKTECIVVLETKTGSNRIVVTDKWGTTTSPFFYSLRYGDLINVEAVTFPTEEHATKFIESWDIHPAHIEGKLTGEYEVIEVEKKYHKVLKGYLPKDVNVSQP